MFSGIEVAEYAQHLLCGHDCSFPTCFECSLNNLDHGEQVLCFGHQKLSLFRERLFSSVVRLVHHSPNIIETHAYFSEEEHLLEPLNLFSSIQAASGVGVVCW